MKEITLSALCARLEGHLDGDPEIIVSGVAPLDTAQPDQVSFLANLKYRSSLESTRAGGVIVSREIQAPGLNLIRVEDPYLGFAIAMEVFYSDLDQARGISEKAFVHPEALVGERPDIHPFAVVCEGAKVGSGVTLMSGSFIGPGVTIGDGTTIHPNVVLERNVQVGSNVIIHAGTVVGSDGFGYAREGDRHRKIIHTGTVKIEDDVEIGAGCAIDRAVMGETVIGQGSKLDNQIQVAHNVRIGRNCIIVAQVGISGSSELEDSVIMAGQSGAAGHLKIGSRAVVLATATVLKDVPAGTRVAGTPAIDAQQWRKAVAVFPKLDDLRKRVTRLERELMQTTGGNKEEEQN